MSSSKKLVAGSRFPSVAFPTISHGAMDLAAMEGWRMLVVYRGKHCPLCKKMFKAFDAILDDYKAAGVSVVAISADPLPKAEADAAAEGWRFPVGYDLSVDQMRQLGLYISTPRSAEETDRPFSEPGLFLVNPDGKLQIIDISNAPFARPDLGMILMGINFVKDKGYPVRGTMT